MQTGHHLSSCARGHMVGGGERERARRRKRWSGKLGVGERQGENKNGHANQSRIFISHSCFLSVSSPPQCESLKVMLKIEAGKERTLQRARAGRGGEGGWGEGKRGGEREREREISGLCFLSQAMTWLIVFFWSNFGTWKTAHLSWRKMMCRTAQMEISSNEKD